MNEDIMQIKKQLKVLSFLVTILSISVFLNTVTNEFMRNSVHEYTKLNNELHKSETELHKSITDALYSMRQLILE